MTAWYETLPCNRPPYSDIPVEAATSGNVGSHYDIVELKMDGQFGILCLGDGTVVLGEYLIGSNRAIRQGLQGQFHAFDIVQVGDLDLRAELLKERRLILESDAARISTESSQIYSRHGKLKAEMPTGLGAALKLVTQHHVRDLPVLWDVEVEGGDHEGAVLKSSMSSYGATWGRIKKEATMDYIILGFNQSKAASKAGMMVQSIRAGLWNPATKEAFHVCDVAGLTNALSMDMCANPQNYTGLVFEAKGKGVFPSGALRHPAFIKMRDDKTPQDCCYTPPVKGDE